MSSIQRKKREFHGLTGTYIFVAWDNIKSRIYRKSNPNYYHYGGRGIRMCNAWRDSVLTFYKDMGDRPTSKHSIDRRNVNGHYSCGKCEQCITNGWPMNCRWTTQKVQMWNQNMKCNNTSGFIGVCLDKRRDKWMANINGNFIGYFDDPIEAAVAYDMAAIFFRGDEARTNIL